MKQPASGAWVTLNASYYVGPLCDPGQLLDDANLLLSGAHGITQSLSELLGHGEDICPDDLANALWGASLLIHMGQRNAEEAHAQIHRMRREIRNDG